MIKVINLIYTVFPIFLHGNEFFERTIIANQSLKLTLILCGFFFLINCHNLKHFCIDETIGANQLKTTLISDSWGKQCDSLVITNLLFFHILFKIAWLCGFHIIVNFVILRHFLIEWTDYTEPRTSCHKIQYCGSPEKLQNTSDSLQMFTNKCN